MANGGRIFLEKRQPYDAADSSRLRPESARSLHRQCLRSRFAAGQAEPGNFPARRHGIARCARTLFCSRGRARRHRGSPRRRHGGTRCRQTEGCFRIAGRWGESSGEQPRRGCYRSTGRRAAQPPADMRKPGTMDDVLKPTANAAWVLDASGYDPLREGSLESRFAISNGFLGIRGARAITRGARWVVPPHTYVAGLFDTLGTKPAIPELVPAADWLQVRISLSGRPLVHHPGDASAHHMTLDLRRGALLAESGLLKTPSVGIRLRTLRLVSINERAVGLQLIQLEVEEGEAELTLEASFDGINLGLVSERLDQGLGVWRTQRSGKSVAMATASSLQVDGHDLPATAVDQLKRTWSWKSRAGQIAYFERTVAVTRSDTQDFDPGRGARDKLDVARHLGWRGV